MRHLRLVAPALALALGMGACGDDSGDDSQSAAAGGDGAGGGEELSDEEQRLAFYDCMAEHGINMPDPEPGGGGIQIDASEIGLDTPEGEAALEECQDLRPDTNSMTADGSGGNMQIDDEQLDNMRDFAECMREHGIDMPDPDPDGGLGFGDDVDPDSSEFQTASEECQGSLGGGGVIMRGGEE